MSKAKVTRWFELPKLNIDFSDHDPDVYGSLEYDPLTSIGANAFVANDHVRELHDIMSGVVASGDVEVHHQVPPILIASNEEPPRRLSDSNSDVEDVLSDDDTKLTPRRSGRLII